MPEYSYGIARNCELSLQLPLAVESARVRGEGYRAELQYIAPHDETHGWYWGVNGELAREAKSSNAELIGILGWRTGRWHVVANPGVERGSGATPAAKAAYRIEGRSELGVELYRTREGNMAFVAWDGRLGRSAVNFGIGHGTAPGDRWIVKAISEIAF